MPGKSTKSRYRLPVKQKEANVYRKGEYREMSQEMMAADHQFKHSPKRVAFFEDLPVV